MICDYGCGQEAKFKVTKTGKMCCSPHRNSCPNMIKKNKKGQKKTGFKWSDEKRKEMSISRSGIGNAMYGKHQSKENKQKASDRLLNKTYVELYGEEKAAIMKQNYSEKMKGRKAWNKGLPLPRKTLIKMRYSIDYITKNYPTFSKIEEMRYELGKEKEKVIQVHCKNHKCPNSKEQGGWFTVSRYFLFNRIRSIEIGKDLNYLYCSEECKEECPLYGKTAKQLIKIDQIIAGHIKEDLYTSEEYQTFRHQVLKRENYKCEYCEEQATDVHHSRPQKLEPGFVLDPDFGVACCESCHYKYGHKEECSTGKLAHIICK
jgi:hypothetical protein